MLDSKTFLLKWNSIWVESYKLSVFVPKYERNSSKVIPKPPVSWPVKESNRVTEKSYLEVVAKPKEDNIYVRKTSQNSFSFSSTEEDKEWLKNCWMASLHKEFEWDDYEEEIQSECGNKLVLRYVGDNSVIIQNLSDLKLQDLESDMDQMA
ncbi:hypothetical protein ACS0TY_035192 [Phlomoides rotata]